MILSHPEPPAVQLHHSWLITGLRGIGKSLYCKRFAWSLLTGLPANEFTGDDPVFRRMLAGAHSDFMMVECAFDAKKEETKREISVEQVREVGAFLALTPAESHYRVVIVDSADDLNLNAANALLKMLEEPPSQAVLLLISHNPGQLLPTLRSRCRILRLQPLGREDFIHVIQTANGDLTRREAEALYEFCPGSPGMALEMAEAKGGELYTKIAETLSGWPAFRASDVLELCAGVQGQGNHAAWRLMHRAMLRLIERVVGYALSGPLPEIFPGEARILDMLAKAASAKHWAELHNEVGRHFSLAARMHLDYKTSLIAMLEQPAA